MSYSLHPDAEQDLAQAADFYRERAGAGLARRFIDEFERVANLISRNPQAGALITKTQRAFHLSIFPYTVVYRLLGTDVQILVVRHQRRKPGFGMRRG